jgi:hypothetical protein
VHAKKSRHPVWDDGFSSRCKSRHPNPGMTGSISTLPSTTTISTPAVSMSAEPETGRELQDMLWAIGLELEALIVIGFSFNRNQHEN